MDSICSASSGMGLSLSGSCIECWIEDECGVIQCDGEYSGPAGGTFCWDDTRTNTTHSTDLDWMFAYVCVRFSLYVCNDGFNATLQLLLLLLFTVKHGVSFLMSMIRHLLTSAHIESYRNSKLITNASLNSREVRTAFLLALMKNKTKQHKRVHRSKKFNEKNTKRRTMLTP